MYKFENLTPEEVNIISEALAQLPFYRVVELIDKLQKQVSNLESLNDNKNQ